MIGGARSLSVETEQFAKNGAASPGGMTEGLSSPMGDKFALQTPILAPTVEIITEEKGTASQSSSPIRNPVSKVISR